jgi:hypothetical protein
LRRPASPVRSFDVESLWFLLDCWIASVQTGTTSGISGSYCQSEQRCEHVIVVSLLEAWGMCKWALCCLHKSISSQLPAHHRQPWRATPRSGWRQPDLRPGLLAWMAKGISAAILISLDILVVIDASCSEWTTTANGFSDLLAHSDKTQAQCQALCLGESLCHGISRISSISATDTGTCWLESSTDISPADLPGSSYITLLKPQPATCPGIIIYMFSLVPCCVSRPYVLYIFIVCPRPYMPVCCCICGFYPS